MSAFNVLCDRLRQEATLAKSNGAGDALAQVLETGGAAQTFAPIGAPIPSPTEAVHRARAQSIQDAAFLNEMKQAGVAPADLVMLDGVLATSRGMPDAARAPAFAAVREQVRAGGMTLSPAARGINWDE
ncbi:MULTISPECIES: hypothetical protein [Enterobacteriaceae]|uniref:hypothetical protein n=2 Tax=Enterobacteriaceae TaxID=543 RepID=UPI00345A8475